MVTAPFDFVTAVANDRDLVVPSASGPQSDLGRLINCVGRLTGRTSSGRSDVDGVGRFV